MLREIILAFRNCGVGGTSCAEIFEMALKTGSS